MICAPAFIYIQCCAVLEQKERTRDKLTAIRLEATAVMLSAEQSSCAWRIIAELAAACGKVLTQRKLKFI